MMSIQKIKEDLKKKLSSKRYEHTMGVEYTSTCLAMRYGADIEKARLALKPTGSGAPEPVC